MPARLPGAALALACLLLPAQAQPSCTALPVFLDRLDTARPYVDARPLKADAVTRVLAWFNALPPASEETFNLAVIVRHVTGEIGLLFGNDDKVCMPLLIPQRWHKELMHAIAGGEPA